MNNQSVNPSVNSVTVINLSKPFLTSEEAAEYLGTNKHVLKNARSSGKLFGRNPGPVYRKVGTRKVLYPLDDLHAWVESAPKMTVVGGG